VDGEKSKYPQLAVASSMKPGVEVLSPAGDPAYGLDRRYRIPHASAVPEGYSKKLNTRLSYETPLFGVVNDWPRPLPLALTEDVPSVARTIVSAKASEDKEPASVSNSTSLRTN